MKIMIVEDELRIRNGLAYLIPKIDNAYKIVAEAENGYEGICFARDFLPDVVITDIKMPKITGLKMIEQIQLLNLHPEYIVLSGYADFKYAQKAIQLGVKEYLLKPISVDELTKALKKIAKRMEEKKQIPEEQVHGTYSKIVDNMVETIHKHYGQRLGLEMFSEKYKMTPEYLSTFFAKETQTTFSNYLRTVRMEKAKEFLETSNLKVYEVGCQVGYPIQKYFSKVFKEYTGVSAKQYVMEKRKDNNNF